MAGSLKKYTTTFDHHYSQVRSALANATLHEWVVVLVEGDDDLPVYEPLFISSKVLVKPAPEENGVRGCRYVELVTRRIVSELPDAQLIGIRDADYTPWISSYTPHPNVFRTEERDMEMMLLRSKQVRADLEKVEQGATAKFEWVRDHICVPRGRMRLLSEVLDLRCSFKEKARISNLWVNKTLCADWSTRMESDFIRHCTGLYRGHRFTAADYNREVSLKRLTEYPWYQICQGHDTLSALQYQLTDTGINVEVIMDQMKASYSVTDFHQTQLYRKLYEFSQQRNWYILK